MDDLRKLFPKYSIEKNVHDYIVIYYDNFNSHQVYDHDLIIGHIDRFKFIHENVDYIIEMLLANGFLRDVNQLCVFKRSKIHIYIYYSSIEVNIHNKDTYEYVYLINPITIFDDLRKIIDIDISYKPTIKNE